MAAVATWRTPSAIAASRRSHLNPINIQNPIITNNAAKEAIVISAPRTISTIITRIGIRKPANAQPVVISLNPLEPFSLILHRPFNTF